MRLNERPGELLARGVCRHLAGHNFATITEFVLTSGLRVDVFAIGPKGEIWIVECKSCRSDYTSDHKWRGYLEWCDRFFWSVDPQFPQEILEPGAGLIVGDEYDAEILSVGPDAPLPASRRKALTLRLARAAAFRAQTFADPSPSAKYLSAETD